VSIALPPTPLVSRVLATSIPGPKSSELHARKAAAVSPGVGVTLPIYVARASDGIIEDIDGNVFVDLGSGIGVTGVGNANAQVVAAVAEQAQLFTHTAFAVTPYESYIRVCEMLNEVTPGAHEKRSALFNSGAEAVENAVKIARKFTGRQAIVVLENGYHGRTNLTMGMTAKSMPFKDGFGPFAPEIYRLPGSYPFRDGRTADEAARITISRIEREIGGSSLAAIVVEPIQGEGGFIVPAPGFLPALAEYARSTGALFIADEIQSGFCRTGDWFASEHEGLVPDLITTAKGIAGGMPLSAVTGRADIMGSVHVGGLGGTYTGNPVACAAAIAAMTWMKQSTATDLARQVERVVFDKLTSARDAHEVIGEVRGRGAMIAMEFAQPDSREPLPDLTARVARECHERGVIVLTTGTYANVIRLLPPFSIPLSTLHEGLDVIREVIDEFAPQ